MELNESEYGVRGMDLWISWGIAGPYHQQTNFNPYAFEIYLYLDNYAIYSFTIRDIWKILVPLISIWDSTI